MGNLRAHIRSHRLAVLVARYLVLRDLRRTIEDAKARDEEENGGDPLVFTVNHIGDRLEDHEKTLKLLLGNADRVGLKAEEAVCRQPPTLVLAVLLFKCFAVLEANQTKSCSPFFANSSTFAWLSNC